MKIMRNRMIKLGKKCKELNLVVKRKQYKIKSTFLIQ